MACRNFAQGLARALDTFGSRSRTPCARAARCSLQPLAPRCISTTAMRSAELETEVQDAPEVQEPFTAAKPFDFAAKESGDDQDSAGAKLLRTLRVVPVSPSYFSAKPTFTDDYLSLSALLRRVATLPTIPKAEAPKVAWKTVDQYRIMTNEPVKTQRFHKMLHILRRLNCIHPQLMPQEVVDAMKRYKKPNQPGDVVPKPGVIDELGRAKGVGRRKTSSAVAWLVEGEGEVLVNGQSLTEYFGRLHHRESAVWALKATNRLDKYNLFGLVQGGGLTGQAEAMTLAVAKALLVHEPALKPAVRRGKQSAHCPCFDLYSARPPFHVGGCIHSLRSACNPCLLHCMPSVRCTGEPHWLTLIQLAASLVTRGRWRGRSLVISRLARCRPGSSVEEALLCISSYVSLYLLAFHRVKCKTVRMDSPNLQDDQAALGAA